MSQILCIYIAAELLDVVHADIKAALENARYGKINKHLSAQLQ